MMLNVGAAAFGAAAVWFVFSGVARTAVRRQILAGISELDLRLGRDADDAASSLPLRAQQEIRAQVDSVLESHLGVSEAQLRSLVADIRKVTS